MHGKPFLSKMGFGCNWIRESVHAGLFGEFAWFDGGGGEGLLAADLLKFCLIYIYIPGGGSPIPGEFITGLEIFLRQFG